jgi:hypothetical protein
MTAAIPAGWVLRRSGNAIVVTAPPEGPGFTAVLADQWLLEGRMLHALADALLKQSEQASALLKLAQYGARMLREHRGDGPADIGDVDGASAQDAAVASGVLVERQVTEACGEACTCAMVGEFPLECFFVPADVRAALAAIEAPGA